MHDQDRQLGATEHARGGAAQQLGLQALQAAGADHDRRRIALGGGLEDRIGDVGGVANRKRLGL